MEHIVGYQGQIVGQGASGNGQVKIIQAGTVDLQLSFEPAKISATKPPNFPPPDAVEILSSFDHLNGRPTIGIRWRSALGRGGFNQFSGSS
jgi:hypothetical protein